MVAYYPEFEIVSMIQIEANLKADVSVDYTVTYFQSLEGEELEAYTRITIVAFILSAILFVEKNVTVRYLVWSEIKQAFFVDMLIQVALPVLCYTIRFTQINGSQQIILDAVGVSGLAGVPWSSRRLVRACKCACIM